MLMLRHLGETEAADRLEKAVAEVLAEGKYVTYDLKPDRNDPTAVGTHGDGGGDRRQAGVIRPAPPVAAEKLAMQEYRQRDKANLLARLRRIEGQVRGISRMIEEDKYCVDILVQIAAVKAALNKVGLVLLEDHTRGCVSRAIQSDEGDKAIDELMDVIMRFIK